MKPKEGSGRPGDPRTPIRAGSFLPADNGTKMLATVSILSASGSSFALLIKPLRSAKY